VKLITATQNMQEWTKNLGVRGAAGAAPGHPGGAPQIDPQQTTLPQDWPRYPAFRLKPGDALTLTETRRGRPRAQSRIN